MASPISERIGSLVGERTRLEALLADNTQWRALCIARAQCARGEAAAEADVARLEQALAVHAVFRAREAVDLAVRELTALAEASPADARNGGPDTIEEATRTRPQVRIHAQPPAVSPKGSAGDLTRIRGIDSALAARLGALGVTCASNMASWTAADVARISTALDVGRRISSENWIEQAAVLAARDAHQHSARKTAPTASAAVAAPSVPAPSGATPGRQAGEAPATREVVVALHRPAAVRVTAEPLCNDATSGQGEVAAAAPPMVPDQLTLIRGLSAEMADWLRAAGVTRLAEIAAWKAGDLACFGAEHGIGEAARRESWIEQAAMLAGGQRTRHAARVLSGEWAALAPPPRADAKPDADLRARLIAASLLTAASTLLRLAPLPLDRPQSSEPKPSEEPAGIIADGAEPPAQAAVPPAPSSNPTSEREVAPRADVREPATHPVTDDAARFRMPRLAEQIAPLRAASPVAPVMAERKTEAALPTLGSWSAPSPPEDPASTPIVAEWSEVVATESPVDIEPEPMIEAAPTIVPVPTRLRGDVPEWLDIPAGEAEVVINHLDEEAVNDRAERADTSRMGAEQAERRRSPLRSRELRREPAVETGPAHEEASVVIYTHGEQPRAHGAPSRPPLAAEESSIDTAAVRRFLKGLTGR